MSYEFYKVLHLLGIFMVLVPLGGMIIHMASGGTRDFPLRKRLGMVHGIGLLIVLIAGFGMLAKLNLMGSFPGWAVGKLVIWLALGALPAPIYRMGNKSLMFAPITVLLGALAAFFAIYKPF